MAGTVMTQRGYTLDELLGAVRRRARLGVVVAGTVVVLGAIVLAALPNEYHAEATIIVEPYRPHPDLVSPAVTTLMEDRLKVARQTLLSEPLLAQVITDQNLYATLRQTHGMDAAVDSLRKRLEVHPDGDSAVVLGYRSDDKDKAAPVVKAIADGFVAANAVLRQSQARNVLASIEKELLPVRTALDDQEGKLRAFRLDHDGELPEQAEENLHEADRASHLLDTAQVYLRALEDRRSMMPTTPTSPEIEHLATVEAELIRDYNHAAAVDAPDHPERVQLERELKGMRAIKAQEIAHIDTLHRERSEIASEIRHTKAEIAALERRVKESHDHAAAAAKWGTALAVLERDRDLLTDKYKSLMSRKVEGEVALDLESVNGPVGTRVVDPPAVPEEPSSPDRMKLLLVVMVLALGLGAGVGIVAESKDATLRTPTQARELLPVPLLAVLPALKPTRRV